LAFAFDREDPTIAIDSPTAAKGSVRRSQGDVGRGSWGATEDILDEAWSDEDIVRTRVVKGDLLARGIRLGYDYSRELGYVVISIDFTSTG